MLPGLLSWTVVVCSRTFRALWWLFGLLEFNVSLSQ